MRMMSMGNSLPIYIIDKLVIGHNHVMFNSALCEVLADIFPQSTITFIAEKEHAALVRSKNHLIDNITYQPFEEAPLPTNKVIKTFFWARKKLGDMAFIRKIYRKVGNADCIVFFTCLSTTSLYYANYLFTKGRAKVVFVLHGEIEFIFKNRIRTLDRIKGWLYRDMLKKLGRNAKCIVLADMIKDKLGTSGIISPEKIIAIDHPIVEGKIVYKALNQDKIVFGHIGIGMEKKNSRLFFQLADVFGEETRQNKTAFHLIGKLEPPLLPLKNGNVHILSENNQSISQQLYEKHLQDIDYSIFMFDDNNYVFRVSGSVMDAIFFQKPIIALKQAYINYLFEIGGNIGFLSDNPEEMKRLIKRIIEKDKQLIEQYDQQKKNLADLMNRFTRNGIKATLSAQLFN